MLLLLLLLLLLRAASIRDGSTQQPLPQRGRASAEPQCARGLPEHVYRTSLGPSSRPRTFVASAQKTQPPAVTNYRVLEADN